MHGVLSKDVLQFLLREAKYATGANMAVEINSLQTCQAALDAFDAEDN